ncbi:hypothetical protein H310_01062 [Aphanomyces invadans]|uniref:Uncharacterized protein n=1 Tax=Aphanomyces invadans TaxID=157072 RepID=A0A024UQQ1_9STRA|nr:hypothetical protein H310_01062 [Aphanomyces invadans]ETW08495.1 hypothetical protein H310_01062 [Aphanomyces invadans]|eukprot:XP_008862300.1 hypothetical protein H310_01062 [Aphanomyces invadans]
MFANPEAIKLNMEIDAMEVLFVSGQLKESLVASREWLVNQLNLNVDVIAAKTNLPLLGKGVHVAVDDSASVLDDETERAIAVYMQSTFELNEPDEILLLADALRILSPVPYHVGLHWGSFLAAMGYKTESQELFTRTLAALEVDAAHDATIAYRKYEEMLIALVTKVWLGEEMTISTNKQTLLDFIQRNTTLTDNSKSKVVDLVEQHILKRPSHSAQAVTDIPSPQTTDIPAPRSPRSITPHNISSSGGASSTSFLADPTTPLIIGAAAVAAVCAIKYRSQLHTSLGEVMTTLQEAKGLLFG